MSEETRTRQRVALQKYEKAEALYLRIQQEPDEKIKTALLREAAELGNPHAQNAMWQRADEGIGMPVDHEEATKWLTCAADYFHYDKVILARRYFDGKYVQKDDEKGNGLLQQAAEKGILVATCELGVSYLEGRGVEKDETVAVKLFKEAIAEATRRYAESSVSSAYFCLGACYELGLGGLKEDREAAFTFYKKSADLGNVEGIKKMFLYFQEVMTKPNEAPNGALKTFYRRLFPISSIEA